MPTHKMHMAIANRVNRELKLDNDLIMIGSVLPDLTIDKMHRISHFKNGEEGIEGTANPYKFLMKYKSYLDNPVMMGYLIHLLTDRFFNSYVFQNYYIYDEDTNLIGIKFHDEKAMLPIEKIRYEKHRDFFVYDKYLLENGLVNRFESFSCIDSIFDIDDAKRKVFYKTLAIEFKVMTLDELNEQFELCIKQILRFLSGLKGNKGDNHG